MSTTQELQPTVRERPQRPKTKRVVLSVIAGVVITVLVIALINRDDLSRLGASERVTDAFYSLSDGQLEDAIGDDLEADWIFSGQQIVAARNTVLLSLESCVELSFTDQVVCRVVTEHDLASALSYEGNETITVTFSEGNIIQAGWEEVQLPDHVSGFWDWVVETQPRFFEVNCEGPDDDAASCSAALLSVVPPYLASEVYTGP